MKRKAMLLLCTALLALSAPAAQATDDVFLVGFTGFDYQDPNPSAGYLEVGEGWKMVGFVTGVGDYLAPWVDMNAYEYTVHCYDLTVATNQYFGNTVVLTFNNNGRGRYYEDDGTAATYGVNPPNATSPSTFIDGTMKLGGDIDDFTVFFDFDTDQGGYSGTMNLDEGPYVTLGYVPAGQLNGWTFGGLSGRPNQTVPDGYDNQVVGECRIPKATSATSTTWGSLKKLYR
jgi:hypothetical protein